MDFLSIESFADLSCFLGIEPKKLGYMMMKLSRSSLYTDFEIPKKSGGYRNISAPKLQLRNIQQKLKNEIEKYYFPPTQAQGFLKKRSIVSNAKQHLKKNWNVNIDIKDFFPSVTSKRVYGLFKSKPFMFNSTVASLIANLLTYDGILPQGSVTSPLITNMICLSLDRSLAKYCLRNEITYTRYADDITFSSSDRKKLIKIYNERDNSIHDSVVMIIKNNGFDINYDKVRCNFYFKHQEVTGIKTNTKTNIKNIHKYKIRSMIRAWKLFGLEDATKDYMIINHLDGNIKDYIKVFLDELTGLIAYAHMVLGQESTFYKRAAHDFNVLAKRTQFFVKYSVDELVQNAVFNLTNYDVKGIPVLESVAFYSNGNFYACLHGVYPEEKFEFLKDFDEQTIKKNILMSLLTCKLTNSNNNYDNPLNLDSAEIVYNSISRDLVIFTIPNIYIPYSLVIQSSTPDRRRTFSVESVTPELNHLSRPCKLGHKKLIGGLEGYPLDIKVTLGESGSPVLIKETNYVVGYITYGLKDGQEEKSFQNGMYDFVNL